MNGNIHVQFLGEGVATTSPPYPTPGCETTQAYPAEPKNDFFASMCPIWVPDTYPPPKEPLSD